MDLNNLHCRGPNGGKDPLLNRLCNGGGARGCDFKLHVLMSIDRCRCKTVKMTSRNYVRNNYNYGKSPVISV